MKKKEERVASLLKLRHNERLNPVTRLRNIESQVCKKCFDKQVVYRIAKYRYNYISVVIIVARMPQPTREGKYMYE